MLTTNIIDFNIDAIFVFTMIIFYVFYRKVYKSYSSRLFLFITISYLIITIIDIFTSRDVLGPITSQIFMFAYYLIKYVASVVYVLYILVITNSRGLLKGIRNKIIFATPAIITIGLLISNIFTGWIYYFEGIDYYRGEYIFVFYGLSFIYVIFGIFWLIYNQKLFSFNEKFGLFSIYAFGLTSLLVQFFFPEVLIEMLATSLAIFLVNSTIERSQLIVDTKTGLKNKKNFKRNINSFYKRKEKRGLVVFYIRNHSILYEKYSYSEALKQLKIFSSLIARLLIEDISYDTYYLENGLYGLITNSEEDAKRLAQRLDSTLSKEYENKLIFNIRYILCSLELPTAFKTSDDFHHFMFNFADSVTYDKRVISFEEIKQDVKHNVLIKLDDLLDNIINNQDILIEYQPIYNLEKKKYTAFEVLARINDKDLGIITADNFVPYAEKKDKMYQIDMIILEKIFSSYKKRKFEMEGIEHVTINISVQTIANPDFRSDLTRLEEKYNINRTRITFEVKEREDVAFDRYDYEAISNLMIEGYSFSLDNYGVGCMPVDKLAKVPFANVKFDNFFASTCKDNDTCIILDNTIKLFKGLNKKTICSGIEDQDTAAIIESLNPNYVQGFYYSKPLDLDNLIKFLNEHNLRKTY